MFWSNMMSILTGGVFVVIIVTAIILLIPKVFKKHSEIALVIATVIFALISFYFSYSGFTLRE